jgi:hypothetical protein
MISNCFDFILIPSKKEAVEKKAPDRFSQAL